ncbi:MAG: carbohydrate porin [Halieaceae bacterium]
MMPGPSVNIALSLCLVCALGTADAWSQEEAEPVVEVVSILEGETSVANEINDVFEEQDVLIDRPARGWFNWKQEFLDRTGVAFGVAALSLYQRATDSREDKDGWGQRYRVNVSSGIGGSGNSRLNARIEYRASVPNNLAPTLLSRAIGMQSSNAGSGYPNDFDIDFSVLNWTQSFNDDTAGLAVGRLTAGSYIDPTPLDGLTGGFINSAFNDSAAYSGPGAGALGAVVKGQFIEGFLIGAHIYDANAVSGEFNDDAFDDGEWLKAFEIGWAPSSERYTTDRVTITYWDKDERESRGIRAGHGWIASASYKASNNLLSLVRYGHSNGRGGARAENSLSVGIDWGYRPGHAWALGLAWAEPSSRRRSTNLRNEYIVETSYRFRLLRTVQVMLDAQLLLDPANNTDESSVWVVGMRTALQF